MLLYHRRGKQANVDQNNNSSNCVNNRNVTLESLRPTGPFGFLLRSKELNICKGPFGYQLHHLAAGDHLEPPLGPLVENHF